MNGGKAARGRDLRRASHPSRARSSRAPPSNWLKLDGAGLVNWLRLTADKAVLANDDLWLEVTVDGESIPAIAAPARFLFPAFAGEAPREFSSMVMTRKEGFANLLAMPFGAGLTRGGPQPR